MHTFVQGCFSKTNLMQRVIPKLPLLRIWQYNPVMLQYQLLHSQIIMRAREKLKDAHNQVFKGESKVYYLNRLAGLEKLEASGIKIHYNKFQISHSLLEVTEKYSHLEAGQETSTMVTVAGRISATRSMGAKLYFHDITESGHKLQLKLQEQKYDNLEIFRILNKYVTKGDYIGVKGYVMKTTAGELSVLATELQFLAPRLVFLTEGNTHKLRYADLLMHDEFRDKFARRTVIINYIRNFLKDRGFLEVKTPLLIATPSGAVAAPFRTFSNSLQKDLFFRIAPELYLKMLVVGDIPKVFEIGPQFRNEALTRIHFPTFTTCEFYAAHSDYGDLLRMTETMVSDLVYKLFGSYKISYNPMENADGSYEINFEPPFERVDVMSSLETKLGMKLPDASDLDTTASANILMEICQQYNILFQRGISVGKLIDKLCDKFLVVNFSNPTFLINHPTVMSPLAKGHRDKPGLSERFELFAATYELCNSYTELNDPCEQEDRFRSKNASADGLVTDEDFIHALRHGLPPTAGWGMGIDRLVMLLNKCQNINQVILFPSLVPNPNAYMTNIKPNKHEKSSLHHGPYSKLSNLRNQVGTNVEDEASLPRRCNDYYENRINERNELEKNGFNLYPHKFESTHSIADVIENHSSLKPGDVTSVMVSVAGRITKLKKTDRLSFCTISNNEVELQLVLDEEGYPNKEEFSALIKFMARGDHLGVRGRVVMTNSGELSVKVEELQILTPCLVQLPEIDTNSTHRYVDLMLNKNTRRRFSMITDIKDHLSNFLKNEGFLEVETPLLTNVQNKADVSFTTHFDDFGTTLHVCTAPELYLVKALVGRMNKVYEIRTQLRNVSPDRTCYPEFTTCQFFMVQADYRDCGSYVEKILSELVYKMFGSYKINYNPVDKSGLRHVINFEPPFERVDVMSALESHLGTKLPDIEELTSSRDFFVDCCDRNGINIEPKTPVAKMIAHLCDKLALGFTNPTFLMNHPLIMCPMAKSHSGKPGLAERCDLLVAGMELSSSYSVINDHREQEARFVSGVASDCGILPDEDYIHALRYGLPSAAGVSLGLDRLAMVLSNCQDIKEVILFPQL